MLFTEQAVLRYAGQSTGAYDDLGNPVLGPPTEATWPAWWEPRTSSESQDQQDQQISGVWLYLPGSALDLAAGLTFHGTQPDQAPGEATVLLAAPLSSADAVVLAGVEYEVDGEPGHQPGGFLVPSYQLAALRRVSG